MEGVIAVAANAESKAVANLKRLDRGAMCRESSPRQRDFSRQRAGSGPQGRVVMPPFTSCDEIAQTAPVWFERS
jgi:hypothetical protein